MKLLDLINEETIELTDKDRKKVRVLYKTFQTGTYKPFPDMETKLKYILPKFNEEQIHTKSDTGKIIMGVDLNSIKMYILTSTGTEMEIKGPDYGDGSVMRNIMGKIKSRFLKYNVIITIF